MKTFKDLVFQFHPIAIEVRKHEEPFLDTLRNARQACMSFPNGYGISVLLGDMFRSNGIDTYEVGILKGNDLCYDTPIAGNVLSNLSEDEVSKIMKRIQKLPDIKPE